MSKRFAVSRVAALMMIAASGVAEAALLNSFTVMIPRVDFAAPGQNETDPNLIVWQTYDDFSGPNLDTGLWKHTAGTLTTGATGLTLTPASLIVPGHSNSGIEATVPISFGGYFAVRMPFVVATAIVDLPGSVDLNIDICDPKFQCYSLAWGFLNNRVPPLGGPFLSGQFFAQGQDENGSFALMPTVVSQGQLAMIYSGGFITGYIDDGSSWQQLGDSFSPPSAWTPLHFEIDAEVDVIIPNAVPEPNSFVLLSAAIAVLGLSRRWRRDNQHPL